MEKTIVLFRAEKHGSFRGDVTAVFPCVPGSGEYDFSCFAHVGQHGSCGWEWYHGTRPAKSEEYADLKRELESKPYNYVLDVRQRISPQMRDACCIAKDGAQ